MNRRDRSVLVGMVLGDGYIRTASAADKRAGRRVAPQISIGHAIAQRPYLEHKAALLNAMFGGNARVGVHWTTDSNGARHRACHFNKSNPYLATLKGMLYVDGRKVITRRVLDMLSPAGIAIWFMDDGSSRANRRPDGSVSSVGTTFSTYCSREEAEAISAYFAQVHGISMAASPAKGLHIVRGNTEASRRLGRLIEPHIHESMRYKVRLINAAQVHECLAPSQTCSACKQSFGALKAKGLCHRCYDQQWWGARDGESLCSMCGECKPLKWFVGSRCRACYVRQRCG